MTRGLGDLGGQDVEGQLGCIGPGEDSVLPALQLLAEAMEIFQASFTSRLLKIAFKTPVCQLQVMDALLFEP